MKYKCNDCGSILDTAHTAVSARIKCSYCGHKNFSLLRKNNFAVFTKTWVAIVDDYLKDNNYNCLKNETKKCYCKIGHLFECAFDCNSFFCIPGRADFLTCDYKIPAEAAAHE